MQRKPRTDQTVMPLTVKQLLAADRGEGDVLSIDGKELSHVIPLPSLVLPSCLILNCQIELCGL